MANEDRSRDLGAERRRHQLFFAASLTCVSSYVRVSTQATTVVLPIPPTFRTR